MTNSSTTTTGEFKSEWICSSYDPCHNKSMNNPLSWKYGLAYLSVPTLDNSIRPSNVYLLLIEPTSRTSTRCWRTDHMYNGDTRWALSNLNSSYWYACTVTSLAEWELDAPGHLQCDYPHRTSKCLQMENIGVYSDMLEAQVVKSYVQRIPGQVIIPGFSIRTNGPTLRLEIKTQAYVCNKCLDRGASTVRLLSNGHVHFHFLSASGAWD